ncbi:hypothetical protein [Aequorivita lipolytica]|uniref:DUF2304 domain-containing protein n=1 Tax=Aequorivita lipolytica TaxID=153267 RepID=A0A5C6YLY0_9FLAO|nr:hypothetical protein [Aequorivita lipolytica]TXD68351.1 hypothetical protein ESV24_12885 [Aequorivita lipolytica]SRX53374.1 hypothetical protein AEQU2_02604 [Aequorivita lipolytica]
MNYILISKVILLSLIFLTLNWLFKKINWQKSSGNNEKFFLKSLPLVLVSPILLGLSVLFFFIFLEGAFDFLSKQNYIEQILILTGFFVIYFIIKIRVDGLLIKRKEKEKLITDQSNQIAKLKYEVGESKKSIEQMLQNRKHDGKGNFESDN